ncbi:hypothetical protein QBC47DRAFT_412072 [Echria macrotheca]|uniref:Uncharacterized protein n=1 Tax=Echria macrotheca TaxID=438768 RepID=A0AAJ0BH22_9PEZI|nr:hypothetical protein QBC47DRAFT_412072 [Echria macrotheca]
MTGKTKTPTVMLTHNFEMQGAATFPPPPSRPFFDKEERIFPFSPKITARLKKRSQSSPPKPQPVMLGTKPPQSGGIRAFRRRSAQMAAPSPGTPEQPAYDDVILFPKVFEDAWTSIENNMNDVDRARIFLLRIATMNGDPHIINELRTIVSDQDHHRTVHSLAFSIRQNIFGDRHADFIPTPMLQAVRFMLIKAKVPESAFTDRHRETLDFFFDPTLHRNQSPLPPGELVRYKYPAGRLKVCIIGGGPTGLASAISLAEKGAGRIVVHVWERRWVLHPNGVVDYPATARRRDQVVTLQDSVTTLLSKSSFDALFAGRPERVWPGSANIQIRKVEDRFLKHCQTDQFRGLIHLHAEGVTREELAAGKCGDFHVLLGTDGAASWVRGGYFRGYENERGRSYALGLAFDRGSKGGLPWSQPLNMFLTLGQTRYLLNASDHDGRGYLNMQLTEEEWHKMLGKDGKPVHFGSPGCLRRPDGSIPEGFTEDRVFAPSEDRNSDLWKSIEDGLKLFGFKESEVINVVRIPIVVQAVREGVRMLPLEDSRFVHRPHALVAVAGDAAMTVHFWPGRGLNSGIKAGIAVGDEIVHALNYGRFAGLELSAMKEYNDFIMKLQKREHDKRSIPILNQSGTPEMLGWLLSKAQSVPDEVAMEWLVGAMTQIGDRLERREDWAFPHEANIEPQIRIVLRQMQSLTLREMAVSFPWPTREMAGAEVLPIRSMQPEEKQKWLQNLWGLLTVEKNKEKASRARSPGPPVSNARFEAPRARSRSPINFARFGIADSPPPPPSVASTTSTQSQSTMEPSAAGSLRRSNATMSTKLTSGAPSVRAPRRFSNASNLGVPMTNGEYSTSNNHEDGYMSDSRSRPRSPSVGAGMGGGEMNLTRLLSVKKPTGSVLSDAMALALFRVDDD